MPRRRYDPSRTARSNWSTSKAGPWGGHLSSWLEVVQARQPIAGTDSCQAPHMGYFISGRMKVVMDDGEEAEFGPGDFMICPPGHDAWIVGNETCVIIDWQGVTNYAKPS